MKKLKITLLFLILAALLVVVYQNWNFFSAQPDPGIGVDLKVWSYQAPEIPHGLYFLGCFLVGFVLAYTTGLMARFRASKMIKELNAVIDSQQEKISTLRGEMDLLKRRPVVEEPAPVEEAGVQPEARPDSEEAPQQA